MKRNPLQQLALSVTILVATVAALLVGTSVSLGQECCSTKTVELETIELRYHHYPDPPGVPSAPGEVHIETTTVYPASRDEMCQQKNMSNNTLYDWAALESILNVDKSTLIGDGESYTATATFNHLSGNSFFGVPHGYTFLLEDITSSNKQQETDYRQFWNAGDTLTLTLTKTFDFDNDTIVSADGKYRIFEIRAIANNVSMLPVVEYLEIVARYRCLVPGAGSPGGVTQPCPEPPVVCPTCEGSEPFVGGAATTCPLPELRTNGSHQDFRAYNTPGSSDCASCSGGPASGGAEVPNSLVIERRLIPANQTTIGNSSPGMYFLDLDSRLMLYEDAGGDHAALLFDPRSERTFLLEDSGGSGTYTGSNVYFEDLSALSSSSGAASGPSDTATATITSHDGWQYEFEIVATALATDQYGGRITKITSPEGFEKTFTYKTFTQAEIDASPTRQFQIDTVTDPSGNVAAITYHPTQQASRWAISDIDVNNGMVTLEYDYNIDGHLETVERNTKTISTYTYGTDSQWNAAFIQWDQEMWENAQARDTIYLSSDYASWGGELVNQFADVLIGRADGTGYRYMAVAQNQNVTGLYRVEYRGQLIEWQQGSYWRYFTTWSNDGSGGYDAYSGTLESTYDHHPGITAAQVAVAQPLTLVDETGFSVDASYDTNGNLYRKHYDGISGTDYEQWLYDSKNRVTYYRDRAGFVTLTERDARGNVVRVSRGHKDVDGDGATTAEPEATQTIFGYYGSGHQNEGLLKWTTTNAYVAGPVIAPSANARTDYEYNASNQLTKVTLPLSEGLVTRSEVSYVWSNGQLFSVTDPLGQTTTYTYDTIGRPIETLYADGTTEQIYRHPLYDRKTYKDRSDSIVTRYFDDSNREYRTHTYYLKDDNILTGIGSNPNPKVDFTYYLAGHDRPRKIKLDYSEQIETDYDYRGRVSEKRRYPSRDHTVHKTTHAYVNNLLLSTAESYPGYSRTTYNGYSADRFTVRKISVRDPSITFADNLAVLNATRQTGSDSAHLIVDAIRDLQGNLVQAVDGRGAITMSTFDALGRQTQTVRGHGTMMALTSTSEYNARGQVTLTTEPAGMQVKTEFDDAGNVKTRTQAFGTSEALATSYTYDAKGRQKTITAPGGGVSESHYQDCCGNVSGSENVPGDGSVRVADGMGRIVYRALVKGFDFDTGNYLDPPAAQTLGSTTIRYDALGRVIYATRWKTPRGQIDPSSPPIAGLDGVPVIDGVTTQTVYLSKLRASSQASNQKTVERLGGGTALIDLTVALQKLEDLPANGGADLMFWPNALPYGLGQATVTISPDEKTMNVSIVDGVGRQVFTGVMTGPASTGPNQLITWNCTQYDQAYNLSNFGIVEQTSQVDMDGNIVSTLRDGLGQGVGTLDQDSNLTRSKFDSGGNLVERVDALSNSVTYVYDDLGRNTSVTNSVGTISTTYGNTTGRVDSRTDAKNNTTSYVYDILGRQTAITDRLGENTVRTYDSAGRLHTLTDAEGNTTTYLYDVLGRETSTTYPDGSVVTMDYDPAGTTGNARKMTYDSGKSNTSYISFDGTLDRTEYRDSSGTLTGTDDYSYDAQLRRSGSTSMDGIVHALTYNNRGQLATDTTIYGGQSYTVTYSYDDRGRQIGTTYPSGRVVDYTYTNRSELDTISWQSTQIEDRAYDTLGRLTGIDRAYTDETRVFDAAGLLLSIDNTGVGTASYTWDTNNNKLSETWTGNMSSWSFTTTKSGVGSYEDGYDAEDRFRRFIQSSQSNDVYLARSEIGNVTDTQVNSTSHLRSYSPAHELLNLDGVTQTFDNDGNLTSSHSGVVLTWNDANQLAVTTNGTVVSTYKYDAGNKRVSKKVVDGVTTIEDTVYIYAGPNCVAEYIYGTSAASPDQEYVYGTGIDSLVLLSRNSDADRSVVLRNQQWSVTALSDISSGAVQERYTYDHFGNRTILAADGVTIRSSSSYNMPYGYTSRRHDGESELMYFRARYYDPTTGEFTSRDPFEYVDGMSMMRGYMGNQLTDSTGLSAGETIVEGPNAAIVSYIKKPLAVNILELLDTLKKLGYKPRTSETMLNLQLQAMINELSESGNPRPKRSYADWNDLLISKEFRNFLAITPQLTCCDGKITSKHVDILVHPGFTPVRKLGIFEIGEQNCTASKCYRENSKTNAANTCWTYTLLHDSRIGGPGQRLSEFVTKVGVPWIWGLINYKLCCSGEYEIKFYGSHFPTHLSYVNMTQTGGQQIQREFIRFLFENPGKRAAAGNGGNPFETVNGTASVRTR